MASIKVKFRPSTVASKKGVIYYQIIQNRVIRQLRTTYHIDSKDWDEATSSVIVHDPVADKDLAKIQYNVEWDVKRLKAIIDLLESRAIEYSAEEIIDFFNTRANEISLFKFMHMLVEKLQEEGKYRTAETYTTTLYSIGRFLDHKDILMRDVTSDLLKEYETSLQETGVTKNSTSFYMRILRAVYNRAVEAGIVEQKYPFKNVYTGIDKTVKHAITMECIKEMKELDYSNDPVLEFARDMFLFSFYTRGMSFIDMAYLKKEDLVDGSLVYRRRKNGQQLYVKWEPCMQEIVDKHNIYPDSPYMLSILKPPYTHDRNQYKNVLYQLNKSLKEIGATLGIKAPLTMYVARHSWAKIAQSKNIDVAVISEGLGHDSEQTTQIYLASLDNSLVDKANSTILGDLE